MDNTGIDPAPNEADGGTVRWDQTKDPEKAFQLGGGWSVNVTVQMCGFQRSNDMGYEMLEKSLGQVGLAASDFRGLVHTHTCVHTHTL